MSVPEQKPLPLWQKIAAAVYLLAAAALVAVFHGRLRADFWPLDASRVAPNILAAAIQLLVATPFLVLLWPPVRRRLHWFVQSHTLPLRRELKKEIKALHGQRERHHAEQMAKMDAIHDHLKQTHPLPKR